MTRYCPSNLNPKEMTHYFVSAASTKDQVQDSSRSRTSAMRFVSAFSSIIFLAMRECARETSWLSGKGSSAYWRSVRLSSSSRRVTVGKTAPYLSSASHIPSRLDFQGGTGLVTPYFSAILFHTCPRSTRCSSNFTRILVTSGVLTMPIHFSVELFVMGSEA